MCLWNILTGKNGPSAKVADGRLILSLPDAETPVIWIMDLNEAALCALRLETDRQGLCVIKRHGGKAAAETVAVYRDRKACEHALSMASHALARARESRLRAGASGQPVVIRPASRLARAFNVFLFIWFVLHITGGEVLFYTLARTVFSSAPATVTGTRQSDTDATPLPQRGNATPPAGSTVGVPLSADDFLNKQMGK